ncbi:Protein CBG25554 [Caenorhabditis briggsae]|uniref:Protein CBG25554 n=1 Tax=Caenorhabditis briggsae TaxID=6238 RepID=B6IF41_CAEBR|nr:Protein CBG25554 [Caenorhabditis briggsae]CAR98521.1 Protein CBG25554 [Caenorhabditis briggsae]
MWRKDMEYCPLRSFSVARSLTNDHPDDLIHRCYILSVCNMVYDHEDSARTIQERNLSCSTCINFSIGFKVRESDVADG